MCRPPGEVGGDVTEGLEGGAPRRKMWTVSVVEDTQSKVDSTLKDMLNILEGIVPLRN